MGSSGSKLLSSQKKPNEEITTISERAENEDPLLQRLKSLKLSTPILTSPPADSTLTDILVRKPSTSTIPGALNPEVLLELLSMYRDWQEGRAKDITQKQEEIENKIEVADALAVKILQHFNHLVSATRTSANHLSGVHHLQVEVGELKGRMNEVISNCNALSKRIAAEGPESLRSSIKLFSVTATETEPNHSSSLQRSSILREMA